MAIPACKRLNEYYGGMAFVRYLLLSLHVSLLDGKGRRFASFARLQLLSIVEEQVGRLVYPT